MAGGGAVAGLADREPSPVLSGHTSPDILESMEGAEKELSRER